MALIAEALIDEGYDVTCAKDGAEAMAAASAAPFDLVRADMRLPDELDGSGLGLKYGVGGGVRLQQGKTFVIRVDVAWSPDARPIGAYLTAGHAF